MAKLKQSLTVDGATLSNLDPDLVITLDTNPYVFIESIGEDTITYGFNGNPDEDTNYQLNVTFTYMGLISYVAPLNIVQRALAEDPVIVEVAPISVEVGTIYKAPFRVILPISGTDVTNGYTISLLEDNAGTHTDYLNKTGGLFFKADTADNDDYVGTYKFTITGTHKGQPVTLSADVPVTIKKWVGEEYQVVFNGGNNNILGVVGSTGSSRYQLLRRNRKVPAAEFKADLVSMEVGGIFSDLSDTVVGIDERELAYTFVADSDGTIAFKITDNDDVPLNQVDVALAIAVPEGLRLVFIDQNERFLKGNKGDVLRVSPVFTFDGVPVAHDDPGLTLVALSPGTEDPSPYVTVAPKQSANAYWEVTLNATTAQTAADPLAFVWEVTYTGAPASNQAPGSVYIYADTPSQITGNFLSDIHANVAQSALIQLTQPTYGTGPNWSVAGAKLTEAVIQIFDQKTNTQVGGDISAGDYTADTNGVIQIDIPRLPYKSSVVYVKGKVLVKNGMDGSGPNFTPVTISPQITKSVAAQAILATPVDNKFNYFNNASTKVFFKLTQEQGDVVTAINAIDVTGLVVSGNGFSTVQAVKETEVGMYSVVVQGIGSLGDATVMMTVQYPLGETQTVAFGLKAIKILPVVTDSPLTVTMWQTGNAVPFIVKLSGVNVTANITEVKLLDNQYVKADSIPGSTKKLWEILYAETAATSTQVSFSYKLVVDGVNTEFTSTGTFNLPAWDGIAFKIIPTKANDPNFSNMRIKSGTSGIVNLCSWTKGVVGTDKYTFAYDATGSTLHGTVVSLTDGHWSTGRTAYVTGGSELGTNKLKIKFNNPIAGTGGYPGGTDKLSSAYWEPTVEVWDDVLLVTPANQTVTGVETKSINIPLQLKWNGANLSLQTTGITYAFAPTDVLTRTGFTAGGELICTINKQVLQDTTFPVKLTVTYGGKSKTVDIDVVVQPNLIKDLVVADAPINVSVWDSGNAYPFTVKDGQGNDASAKLTNVELVPNTYVVNDTGGKLWYINTAETTARDVSTKFLLTFTVSGRTFTSEFNGTFKLAAWDGITLKPNPTYGDTREFSVMLGGSNSFIFRPLFKGKPAGDLVTLESITGLVNGAVTIVSQEVVEAGAGVKVTISASGKTGGNTTTFRYRVKGTSGGVANKDYVDDTSVPLPITAAGLYVVNMVVTPTTIGSNGISRQTGSIYFDGIRIKFNDPRINLVFTNGTPLDYLGADEASFYARCNLSGSGSVGAPYTIHYNDNGTDRTVQGNWVFNNSGAAASYAEISPVIPGIPSSDNELLAPVRIQSAGTAVTTLVPIIPYKVTKNPANGDHLINPEEVGFVFKDGKSYITFKAGHTGGTFVIKGMVRANGVAMSMVPTTYTIPKATVTTSTDQASYTSDEANLIKVKFKLSQPRYGVAPFDFAGSTFEAIGMSGATGTGEIVTESDGWFSITLTVPPTGTTARVTGTVRDVTSGAYPFTIDVVINPPADLVMGEGFVTSGEGDKDHPLTLVQSVVFPIE